MYFPAIEIVDKNETYVAQIEFLDTPPTQIKLGETLYKLVLMATSWKVKPNPAFKTGMFYKEADQ